MHNIINRTHSDCENGPNVINKKLVSYMYVHGEYDAFKKIIQNVSHLFPMHLELHPHPAARDKRECINKKYHAMRNFIS